MMKYELLYIVPNKYTEKEVGDITKKIAEIVEKENGKITKTQNFGKLKLAYPIKHVTRGYYEYAELEATPASMQKIENLLLLNNDILRHLLLKYEKGNREGIKSNKIPEKTLIKNKGKKITEKKAEVKETETPKTKTKEKVDLDDLDKKLEEIIDSDII